MTVTPQRKESLPLQIEPLTGNQLGVKRVGLLHHSFYFLMSLLVAVVVVYGFSQTVNARLIHPPSPRPMVLIFTR